MYALNNNKTVIYLFNILRNYDKAASAAQRGAKFTYYYKGKCCEGVISHPFNVNNKNKTKLT